MSDKSGLEKLVHFISRNAKQQDANDFFATFLKKNGGVEGVESMLRTKQGILQFDGLWSAAEEKAESVLRGAADRASKEGMVMDDDTRKYVRNLAMREAVARILNSLFSTTSTSGANSNNRPAREPASPLAEGARFDQLNMEVLSSLFSSGVAVQSSYLSTEWHDVACADLSRMIQFVKNPKAEDADTNSKEYSFNPLTQEVRFPAFYSVAELMSSLPHELNLRAKTRYCEVGSEFFVWNTQKVIKMNLAADVKEQLVISYVISLDTSKSVHVNNLKLTASGLFLLRIDGSKPSFTLKGEPNSNWFFSVIVDCLK